MEASKANIKILDISCTSDNKCISLTLERNKWAKIYYFANTTYTTVSDELNKSSLKEIKKDCLEFFRSKLTLKQLKERWKTN